MKYLGLLIVMPLFLRWQTTPWGGKDGRAPHWYFSLLPSSVVQAVERYCDVFPLQG